MSQFPKELSNGAFKRQKSIFRSLIDEATQFRPEKGRYHLYLSHACPWAHRTLIVRALKELESAVSVSFVHPIRDEKGWCFESEDNQYSDPIIVLAPMGNRIICGIQRMTIIIINPRSPRNKVVTLANSLRAPGSFPRFRK